MTNPQVSNDQIFVEISAELSRARQKFPGNEDQFAALTEEVGELAKDLLQQKHEPGKGKSHEHIFAEAVQVAAMAIRIATEGASNFPDYHPESGYRGPGWEGYRRPRTPPFSLPECVFHYCPNEKHCRVNGCFNKNPNYSEAE